MSGLEKEHRDHYQWIEANVNETYGVFLTHPWKAPVLTAVTV